MVACSVASTHTPPVDVSDAESLLLQAHYEEGGVPARAVLVRVDHPAVPPHSQTSRRTG